jgi:N-acetylglutamate synthase-like GNAT family acetyltransferase
MEIYEFFLKPHLYFAADSQIDSNVNLRICGLFLNSYMQIREAKESDVLFLKRLLVQLGYPDHDETGVQQRIDHHRQEGYRLLVAEMDQEVVGFIALHWFHLLHLTGNLGRISAFRVDERFRSPGIGVRLLETAEEFLQSKGAERSK